MAGNTENRYVTIYVDGRAVENTLKSLRQTSRQLTNELARLEPETEDFIRKSEELRKVNERIRAITDDINGVSESFGFLKGEMGQLVKSAAGLFTISKIGETLLAAGQRIISQNAELSDSYAAVMKSTGLTEVEVNAMNESFKRIDTRTASGELLNLAFVAGKLGISAKKDVEDFVKAADMIGVALGEDLGGTEQAINTLGKLAEIFKIEDQYGISDALLKLGSTINTLGASGTANEEKMIDFAKRLAGLAPSADISAANVLGLGAKLDELGQSMETSSTAIGKFLVEMGTDLPKFAKIAGVTTKEFSDILAKDANEAFIMVLEKSRSLTGGIEGLASSMQALEIKESGAVQALSALANNTDGLRASQALATEEFNKGTSVIAEFNTVNTNLQANLDKLKNKWDQMWENSTVRAWLTDVTANMIGLVDKLNGVDSSLQRTTDSYRQQRSEMRAFDSEVGTLMSTYDDLKGRTNLSKEEQERLNKTIQDLSVLIPAAVSEWDKYGRAIDINRAKVEDFTKKQRELFEIRERDNIQEIGKTFAENMRLADAWQKQMRKSRDFIDSGKVAKDSELAINHAERIKRAGDQNTLALGQAYDAAVALRDVYGQTLTKPMRDIITYFDGINGTAPKSAAALYTFASNASAAMTGPVDEVRKHIKLLKDVLNDKSYSEDAHQEAQVWFDKLNARLAALTKKYPTKDKTKKTPKTDEERAQERATELAKKLLNDEKLFAAQQLIDKEEYFRKEIAQEEAKYDKLISAREKFLEEFEKKGATKQQVTDAKSTISDLNTQKEAAVAAKRVELERESTELVEELRVQLGNKHASELQKEKNRIEAFYKEQRKRFSGNAEVLAQLQKDEASDLANAEIHERERIEKETKDIKDRTAALVASDKQRELGQIDVWYEAERQKLLDKFATEYQDTVEFYALMDALEAERDAKKNEYNQKKDRDLNKTKKEVAINAAQDVSDALFTIGANNRDAEMQAALASFQRQRESELSNKNLTEAQKKSINERYDRLERAEKLKAWKAQKNADLLQAGINMALGVTRALASSPPPLNWINAAAVGAAGVLQMGVIAATKAPQFFHGGFTDDPKGWVRKPTIFTGATGKQFSAGENSMPEYVVSSEQLRNPVVADFVGMMESGRENQVQSLMPSQTIVNQIVDNSRMEGLMIEMIAAYNKAADKKVYIPLQDIEDAQERKARILTKATA